MCKFGTRNDAKMLREDVRVRDARECMWAHLWCENRDINLQEEPQDGICEICGYEDASVHHGICPDCRQQTTNGGF